MRTVQIENKLDSLQEKKAKGEVEEDEQEERAEEEVEDNGADLLSGQEDNTHDQYIGKKREVLEQERQLAICYHKVRKLFYHKVRQVLLQNATAIINCDSFITKCGRYFKVR